MQQRFAPGALILMASVCLLGYGSAVTADIYKYLDPKGRIYLTDKPMPRGYRLLKVFKGMGGASRGPVARAPYSTSAKVKERRKRFAPMIEAAAVKEKLKPELLHAVVLAESAYDPGAISSAGAAGLMQLMPDTAKRFGVSNRWGPEANVAAGARYLRELLDLFNHDLELALAAYNAGESAVQKYGNQIPPYPETQHYVQKVLSFYQQKQSQF